MEAGTGNAMTKELSLRNSILTLSQANCEAMDAAQLQDEYERLS